MARAYYGSRFSENLTKTEPEGYLVCHNVPIARTGIQKYAPNELGLDGNDMIDVARSEDEVFNEVTIASFEGKPVTDLHPPVPWPNPNNFSQYLKGVTTNVRRGKDNESDYLLADLIIYDSNLINAIMHGKRQISCGYDCEYKEIDGVIEQKNIIGNHVAVVPKGRAGEQVAIKDEAPTNKKEVQENMSKKKSSMWARIMQKFAADSDPEEFQEVADFLAEKEEGKDEEMHSEQSEEKFFAEIVARLTALEEGFAKLSAPKEEVVVDELSALEKEMTNGQADEQAKEEESKTVEAKEIDNAPVESPEDRPKNPIPSADSLKMAIANSRAICDGITDPKERAAAQKRAADSIRKQIKSTSDAYAQIIKPKKAADAQVKSYAETMAELEQSIKEKYHRQPIGGKK